MKKTAVLFVLSLFFFLFPKAVFGQNKAGINIGDHFNDFDKAAAIVGPGGWVVIMACPGDGDKIAKIAQDHPEINLVIRGHYPGQNPPEDNNKLAKLWGATLASIPFPNKVYFMPWNEPNHEGESGGATAGNKVYQYSQFLKSHFQDLGILGSKVILLSPMVDKLNSSFVNGSFFTNDGGKEGFYNLFQGSAINEYDQFSSGPCSATPPQNNCQYDAIGIPGPYYALETGVAGTCTPPCYKDNDLRQMFDRSWQKWSGDANFKMFAIFSYDPHRSDWDIFSNGSRTVDFLKSISSSSGGCCTQSISPSVKTPSLSKCPGKAYSFYTDNESECYECGGESFNLQSCVPVPGDNFGEELGRKTIPLDEQAIYQEGEDCLEAGFEGLIDIKDLKIPLVKDLNKYFLGSADDLPVPVLSNNLKNAGVLRLLTSKQQQDNLKKKFLKDISDRGSNTKYALLKIGGMGPLQIIAKFEEIDQKSPSLRSNSDNSFLKSVWARVPLFANEESQGEIILQRNTNEAESRVETSVPEVFRLNEVTTLLSKMLVPGYSNRAEASLQNQNVLQAAAESGEFCPATFSDTKENDKKSLKGPGEEICTTLGENKLKENRSFANDAEKKDCSPREGDCGSGAKPNDACCGGNGHCSPDENNILKCTPNDSTKKQTFKGSLRINNRVPFLLQIAKNTIGQNGLFRIFLPAKAENQAIFEDVPAENTDTKVSIFNIVTSFLKGSGFLSFHVTPPATPESTGFLFHQVGTLQIVKDYVSGKLLGLSTSGGFGNVPEEGSLDYEIDFRNSGIRVFEDNKARVTADVLKSWPLSKIAQHWDFVYNQALANGWNPAFIIALWIEESAASGVSAYDLGCLEGEENNIGSQLNCLFARPYKDEGFTDFMCMYSEGKSAPCHFSLNPNFPGNLKYWYDQLTM